MHKESMRPVQLAPQLDISLTQMLANSGRGAEGVVEGNVPRMRSCRVGKLSELGVCLEALVNTISLGRKMILTLHNRELVLSRYQAEQLCL